LLRGFAALALTPFRGERGPVRMWLPDINTEDSPLRWTSSPRDFADPERVASGICGWGGMALNAAAWTPASRPPSLPLCRLTG
jgi:hypothetical protein